MPYIRPNMPNSKLNTIIISCSFSFSCEINSHASIQVLLSIRNAKDMLTQICSIVECVQFSYWHLLFAMNYSFGRRRRRQRSPISDIKFYGPFDTFWLRLSGRIDLYRDFVITLIDHSPTPVSSIKCR